MMPHFYQTYWFYILLALTAVMMVASGYRYRIRQMKMQGKKTTRLVDERIHLLEQQARQLEQSNQHWQRLSCLDGLTGIANRRHFEEVLDLEWRRARRASTVLSLIMIDTDFFKAFNDAYGHQRGDDCLKQVAIALHHTLNRAGDLVARYGGEEFMIILPETGAQGAATIAEALRASVEALEIPHGISPADRIVTISLGVVTGFPGEDFSAASLITAADGAMYQAKREGRNRVSLSETAMLV